MEGTPENYKIDNLKDLNEQRKIIRKGDPHYKTPLAFAEWRVDELKKPRSAGTINNIIDATVSIFLGVLGQHRTNVSYPTLGENKVLGSAKKKYYKALIPLIIYIILFIYDAHAYRLLVAMVVLILTFVNSSFNLFLFILVVILAFEICQLFAPKDA